MRVGDLRELSCRETTKEMRAQMRQQAHQSPNAHRRVLPAVVFCRSVVSISADK